MTTTERYNLVSKFIHNQTDEQWLELCNAIINKQGDITGSYPTNWVSREDVESQVNDERIAKGEIVLTDKLMADIARCIGESDTEYGTYWESLSRAYYDLTRE